MAAENFLRMSSVGGESFASRISEQRLKRQEIQRQLEILRNRVNLLKVEEGRSAKKSKEIETKTREVLEARERHARDLTQRGELEKRKIAEKLEVKEKVQRVKEELKTRSRDTQAADRSQKAQLYAQTKADETEALRLKAEIAELEKSRGIALKEKLKAESEARKARREAEKMARLLEAQKRTKERLKEEEEETKKVELLVAQFAEEERRLIDRVKESQNAEFSAFTKFEQLLLRPSVVDFSARSVVDSEAAMIPKASPPPSKAASRTCPDEKVVKRGPVSEKKTRNTYVTATGRVIELEEPLLELNPRN